MSSSQVAMLCGDTYSLSSTNAKHMANVHSLLCDVCRGLTNQLTPPSLRTLVMLNLDISSHIDISIKPNLRPRIRLQFEDRAELQDIAPSDIVFRIISETSHRESWLSALGKGNLSKNS
jgi:hypothetical protein